MALGDKAAALALAERAMAANPIEKDALAGPCVDRVPRPSGSAVRESPTAPSLLYKNYSRYRT